MSSPSKLCVLVLLVACSTPPSPDAAIDVIIDSELVGDTNDEATDLAIVDAPQGEPRIEVGIGASSFGDVVDGSDQELIMGSQGGWHLDIAVRLYNLNPEQLDYQIDAFDAEDDSLVSKGIVRVLTQRRVADRGEYWLRLGDQLVFDIDSSDEIVGKQVRFVVRATEPESGRGAIGRKTVGIVDNEE